MNVVHLIGRLTRDPEVNSSKSGQVYARFTLAVDRRVKKGQEKEADFPRCVAFGRTAEVIGDYAHKGTKLAIEGRMQTDSWTDKDGNKRSSVQVIVNAMEFCEKRQNGQSNERQYGPSDSSNDFDSMGASVPDMEQEEIPF